MRKALLLAALSVGMLLCGGAESFGGVGGLTQNFLCGASGTLYANLVTHSVDFDLLLNNTLSGVNGKCRISFSWVDAQGTPQTEAANAGFSTIVASSIPTAGVISWESAGTGYSSFSWGLQRDQAASLATTPGFRSNCGAGGQAYVNATGRAVELDLSLENDNGTSGCHVEFSWIDAAGDAEKLAPAYSEGISTSLPAGAAIVWTSAGGGSGGASQYFWQIERAPTKP